MRTFLALALAACIGLLLQTALLPVLPFGEAAPDILLILCVYLGLHHHSAAGAFGAFLLGYLQDSVSGSAIGLNAFAMTLVFLLVHLTCRSLWVDNVISRVVLVFLASLIKTAAIMGLLVTFVGFDGSWRRVLGNLGVQAVVVAAIAPFVLALLSGIIPLLRQDAETG
jgi:rod shape-determining protein MreD